MSRQLLVVQKRDDRLEHYIPYIERIAQPGMRVVFLMRGVCGIAGGWAAEEGRALFRAEAGPAGRRSAQADLQEEEAKLSEQRVFRAQEALRKGGVEIDVEVYTGSLKKTLERYTRRGDVPLILVRAGGALRLLAFLKGKLALSGYSRQGSFSPVLLLRPGPSM